MTTPLPRDLESKAIADALSQIFNQPQNQNLMEKITHAVEVVTTKQEGLYTEVVELVNESQKKAAEVTEPLAKITETKARVGEELNGSAKQLLNAASTEIQQRYQHTIAPSSLQR